VEDALTKLVEKWQQAGQFSTQSPARTLARFIFANISRIRVAAQTGAGEKTLRDIADVVLSALK
jgi:TetR/AcrR family transcriptional repressor of nem operon